MNRRTFTLLSSTAICAAAAPALSPSIALAEPKGGAPTPKTSEPEAARIGGKVQAFYDSAKTFRANFRQRYTIYAYNRTKDSSGEVVFSKPGKMRWTYSNNENVVVSDGKQLKIYEQENRQMYLQSVEKTQYPAALTFLLGDGKLTRSFILQKLDSKKLGFPGGHVLLGTPKSPTPAFQKILFYIDQKTFQVRRVLLIDAQKNRNRFDFEKTRVNEPIPAKRFRFTPPAGTNIVKP